MRAKKSRRGPPPLPRSEQRQRLLDAAHRLLDRHELNGAGVRQVVAEAGMSSRAFYELFDSKDELILELAREMGTQFLERLAGVPDPSESFDGEQIPDLLLDVFAEVAAPMVALDGAGLTGRSADELRAIRAGVRDGTLDHMFQRFERSVRAGRLTALPDRTAFEIVLRGIESLTADLGRGGRLADLKLARPAMRRLLVAQAPFAPRPKRGGD